MKVELDNSADVQAFSFSQCINEFVQNAEDLLHKLDKKLLNRGECPLRAECRPEFDVHPELAPQESTYQQFLIGMMTWMIELGRSGVFLEVSMTLSHLVLPRGVHLDKFYHIFSYLKNNCNTEMVFDPSDPIVHRREPSRGNIRLLVSLGIFQK